MRLLLPTKKTQYYFMTNLYKIPLAIVINYYIFGDLCLTLFKTVINNFLFNKSQLTVNVMNLCAFRLNNLPCNAIYRDCSGQRRHLTPLCTSGTFPPGLYLLFSTTGSIYCKMFTKLKQLYLSTYFVKLVYNHQLYIQ